MKNEMISRLKKAVEEKADRTVVVREVTKNNGVKLVSFTLVAEGENVAPCIYVDRWLEDDMDIDAAADTIVETWRACTADIPDSLTNFTSGMSKQFILDHAEYALCNAEMNRATAAEAPHRDVLDLSVFYRCEIESGPDGKAGFLVHNEMMSAYGIESSELEAAAAANAQKQTPVVLNMTDMIREFTGQGDSDTGMPKMYVLTNEVKFHGAWTMLSEDVVGDLADNLGCDLMLLPSSIHEVIAIPAGDCADVEFMKAMVRDVNAAEVALEEQLGENVYLYNRAERTLTIAE